jgi:hypothetical protein
MTMMAEPKTSGAKAPQQPRQSRLAMVGVRMTPDRETEVKIEAARRGLSVAALFDEIWQAYMNRRAQ